MCRMARGQATCQKTHAVEIDTSVLPQYLDTKTNKMRLTTDSYTLQRDQRWIPTLKPTVSLPKSSNRRDIDLPEAARGCGPLHVDKRVIQVDLLRPKLDTVTIEDITTQIHKFCADHDLDLNKDFVHVSDAYESTLDDMIQTLRKRLGLRNGLVVETNDVLAMCTQSQSNVQWLSSAINSRNAFAYMTSYLGKRKVTIATTFALMASVRKQILSRTFQSREDDVGTNSRTAKHFLARFNNMLMKKMEVSASQAAQCLLQLPVFFTSETFRKCFFTVTHDYVVQNRAKDPYYVDLDGKAYSGSGAVDETDAEGADTEMHDRENPQAHMQTPDDTYRGRERTRIGYGLCPTYAMPPDVEVLDRNTGLTFSSKKPNLAVPQHINYAYRGKVLTFLNIVEYASVVDGPRKTDDIKEDDKTDNPTGLKWKFVGNDCPVHGQKISNGALEDCFRHVPETHTFTKSQWLGFNISELCWDSYVHVSDAYFMPARRETKPTGLNWVNAGDSHRE